MTGRVHLTSDNDRVAPIYLRVKGGARKVRKAITELLAKGETTGCRVVAVPDKEVEAYVVNDGFKSSVAMTPAVTYLSEEFSIVCSKRESDRKRFTISLRVTLGFIRKYVGDKEYEYAKTFADHAYHNPTPTKPSDTKKAVIVAAPPVLTKKGPGSDIAVKELVQAFVEKHQARAAMSAGRPPLGKTYSYSVVIKPAKVQVLRAYWKEQGLVFEEYLLQGGKLDGATTFRFPHVSEMKTVEPARGRNSYEHLFIKRVDAILASLEVKVVYKKTENLEPGCLIAYMVQESGIMTRDKFTTILENCGIELTITPMKRKEDEKPVAMITIERPEPPIEFLVQDVARHLIKKFGLKRVKPLDLSHEILLGIAKASQKH